MRRLLLGLLPAVLVVFACGSDAPAPAEVTELPDAQADGSPVVPQPDGAAPVDAASDAPAGPFCASLVPAPKICEDFDDGQPPLGSDTQIDPGASCAIDTSISLSPSSSYRCSVPPGTTTVTNALLRTLLAFDASATRFVASFAFRPDAAAPTTGNLVIARAFIGSAHAIAIELASPNGPVLREQENPPGGLEKTATISALPAAGAWTRYELLVDLTAKTATLKVGGAVSATLTLSGAQYNLFALNIGIQADAPFTGRFDDITLTN
jgi:hypothetical protein